MASRGRVALIAVGVGAAVLVMFVATIWLLIAVTDDGLPGGAKVAVVEIEGVIGTEVSRGLDTEEVVRTLLDYRDDASIRAVVLRINSPGGVVAPTQEIASAVRRLREAKKPVVASLGSVAASGGYYVAVAADRIFASPGTLTGSIGVVMQLANVEGLLKKVGVEYVVVKAGAFKDVGNFARPMTPEERRILQSLLDDVYEQFIGAVAEGRHLDPQEVRGFAEGRIFSGRQAQTLKMVDELGGLQEAVEAAARMAGLPGKPKVVYPRRRFSLRDLLRTELGLGPVSRVLPSLETLRTPLYLMP